MPGSEQARNYLTGGVLTPQRQSHTFTVQTSHGFAEVARLVAKLIYTEGNGTSRDTQRGVTD
jgi:hypothetical protein